MENEKECPLTQGHHCNREDCAWWVSYHSAKESAYKYYCRYEGCALQSIAYSLMEMEDK